MEKRARVLIVDDRQDNVYFLRALLQGHGYEVVTANHGAEALELSRANPPDLVIADILMPVMDGFILCREWRRDERLKRIPFVFYTATYTDERDREFALSLGADRFILKPEDPDKLIVMIRDLIKEGVASPAPPSAPPAPSASSAAEPVGETVYLKQYSEALVRKLEAKTLQLEQYVRSMQQDIVARKQAEEALRSSEIRFRELFNNMTSGVAVYEASDDGADFVFKDINKAGLETGGLEKDAVVGRKVTEVFPGVGAMGLLDVLRRVWKTGLSECFPAAHYADERISHWYENHVYKLPSGEVIAVYNNVTEQKRAEEALRESELRFRNLVERAPDVIYTLAEDGTISSLSPRFEAVSDWRRDEWVGKPFTDMVHPDDLPAAVASFQASLRGETPPPLEMRVRLRSGEYKPFEMSSSPLVEHGRIVGELGIARDISERRKSQEAIRNQLHELKRWHDATIGREERIAELKKEINELQARLGEKPKYKGSPLPTPEP